MIRKWCAILRRHEGGPDSGRTGRTKNASIASCFEITKSLGLTEFHGLKITAESEVTIWPTSSRWRGCQSVRLHRVTIYLSLQLPLFAFRLEERRQVLNTTGPPENRHVALTEARSGSDASGVNNCWTDRHWLCVKWFQSVYHKRRRCWYLLFCRHRSREKEKDITAFIVEKGFWRIFTGKKEKSWASVLHRQRKSCSKVCSARIKRLGQEGRTQNRDEDMTEAETAWLLHKP